VWSEVISDNMWKSPIAERLAVIFLIGFYACGNTPAVRAWIFMISF
jgi:hypothetical protein